MEGAEGAELLQRACHWQLLAAFASIAPTLASNRPPCRIASFKDLSLQALQAAGGQAAAATGASHFNALAPPPTLKELRSGDSGSGAATGAAAPAVSSAASSGVQQQQAGAGGLPTADAQPVAASSASTGAGSSEGGVRTSSGGGLRRRPFEQRAEELTALANRWVIALLVGRGSAVLSAGGQNAHSTAWLGLALHRQGAGGSPNVAVQRARKSACLRWACDFCVVP